MIKKILIILGITLLLTGCKHLEQAKSDAEATVDNIKELQENLNETNDKLEAVNQKLKDLKIAD